MYENKENFKYLDIADLLNIFKVNWETVFRCLDKKYRKYKYDAEYKAVNIEGLKPDIKLSIDRTTLRLHSMRTVEEIMRFFNNAIHSERVMIVQKVLIEHGLSGFEDIKNEVNKLYTSEAGLNEEDYFYPMKFIKKSKHTS
jgi:hypothetical protein